MRQFLFYRSIKRKRLQIALPLSNISNNSSYKKYSPYTQVFFVSLFIHGVSDIKRLSPLWTPYSLPAIGRDEWDFLVGFIGWIEKNNFEKKAKRNLGLLCIRSLRSNCPEISDSFQPHLLRCSQTKEVFAMYRRLIVECKACQKRRKIARKILFT